MVFFFLNARGPLGGGLVFYAGRCIACACGSWLLLVSVCARWLGGPLLLAPLPSTAVGGDTGDGCRCTARPMTISPESSVPDDGCTASHRVYGAVAIKKWKEKKSASIAQHDREKGRGRFLFLLFCQRPGRSPKNKESQGVGQRQERDTKPDKARAHLVVPLPKKTKIEMKKASGHAKKEKRAPTFFLKGPTLP